MTQEEFCFTVGVPGSSWSMLSHRLKLVLGHNMSDLDKVREHTFDASDVKSHFGSYFGPNNEFGDNFDDILNHYTLEEFYKECRRPFLNNNGTIKSIRSHWFAYNLDWIWDNCKGQTLFFIYKESTESVDWWLKRGGWGIQHPNYSWYENTERLTRQVQQENNNLLKFAEEKKLKWEPYHEGWWLEKFGKEELIFQNRPPDSECQGGKILVIYTKIF